MESGGGGRNSSPKDRGGGLLQGVSGTSSKEKTKEWEHLKGPPKWSGVMPPGP